MASILVISPDPEARRMLQLAFELDGATVLTAIDAGDARAARPQVEGVVLDLIDGGAEQWNPAREVLRQFRAPTAILLPRGWGGRRPPRAISGADLIVPKPYELLDVVRRVKGMAEGKKPAPRKKKPLRKGKARRR